MQCQPVAIPRFASTFIINNSQSSTQQITRLNEELVPLRGRFKLLEMVSDLKTGMDTITIPNEQDDNFAAFLKDELKITTFQKR